MIEKLFKKRIKEIHDNYNNKNVLIFDDKSNFFGQESLGLGKIRGNGVLLLTENELYFGMWKPKKEILIPVKSITDVTNPRSHMHRSILRPLLKVIFKNENGQSDSAAWFVQNLDQWKDILKILIPIDN
ncbi:MAG: hypothetical protein ACFE8B_08375 [Candidatus Hermodarchaeota archaeon]